MENAQFSLSHKEPTNFISFDHYPNSSAVLMAVLQFRIIINSLFSCTITGSIVAFVQRYK